MDEVDIHATPHEKSRNDLQSMKATRSIIRCYRPPGLRKSSFHNCCRISCPAVKIVGGLPADEAWQGRFANCDWRVTAGKLSLADYRRGFSLGKRFNIGIRSDFSSDANSRAGEYNSRTAGWAERSRRATKLRSLSVASGSTRRAQHGNIPAWRVVCCRARSIQAF